MSRLGRAQRFKPLTLAIRLVIPGIFPTAIDTAEAFGVAALDLDFTLTSIPSDEAFGTPVVGDSQVIFSTSIDSAEAFGTISFDLDVAPTGIGSDEAFGNHSFLPGVVPVSIGSDEAFGTVGVGLEITPPSISSSAIPTLVPFEVADAGEVFGNHFVGASQALSPSGIQSAEVWGVGFEIFNQDAAPAPATTPRIEFAAPEVLESKLLSDARVAMGAADMAAAIELAAPTDILVTLYDKVYRVRGECNDYISLKAAFPRHLVESGQLVMKTEDPLAPAALMCHEEVVPITIEIGNMLWSGRIKVAKDRFGWPNEADSVVCDLEGDRAWLMKIMAWPDFLLPIQVQFPPRGVAIGPAISIIRWMIATQTFRLQSGLHDLINNLGSLNLDWRSWFGTFLMTDLLGPDGHFDFSDIMRMLRTPIYVCKTNLSGALSGILTDTSPFVSINWRMDKMYDLIDQLVKDNGLVVEVNLWRPGDPQPDDGMLFPLTVPTIVVDAKDRMGIVGPTGTFFDGILRTLVDLQDSVFGEITQPFLNPQNLPVPDGFNIAPLLGVNWIPPWAIFMADHPQSGCWGEMAHHHPLAWRTIIGGKSPKWMNDLINATMAWLLDMVMIIIGLTGIPSNLLDGLFNDVLLAFQLADNMSRRIKLGPYGYPEWFAPTGHAPYNIDAIFALKREQWNTRGYVSGIVNFNNGYPYEIGRDLFQGSLASIVRRGKVYTDFVENIIVTDTRDKCSVEVQIGDGIAEEHSSVKTYRNLVKFQEALNIITMSTQ